MFLESRICWKEKPSSNISNEGDLNGNNEKKKQQQERRERRNTAKNIKQKTKNLEKKVKASDQVIEKTAIKEANEKEKNRTEVIISTTGAIVENLKDEKGETSLEKDKPAKEEAKNLEKRKIHDQQNAEINAENAIKNKNKIVKNKAILIEHKNKFLARLKDIQKLKNFPNKKKQIENIKKQIEQIENKIHQTEKIIIIKKEEVAANKQVLKKGEIDIKKLQSLDKNNKFSEDSIELVGDYVFRNIGLETLKKKVFAIEKLSSEEKQRRYEQIATAAILYKIETPTSMQEVNINRLIAQEKEKGKIITQQKKTTITKIFLKEHLTPKEKEFLQKDNGKTFLKNEKIFKQNKQKYISSALETFPQLYKNKNKILKKQEPDFLIELSQLNSEHLQYYQDISNKIEPREIKNIIHHSDGRTTMFLEEDISLTIPKNNNPANFSLDINGKEKQITYNEKNIEKTIETQLAFQTLENLGLEKYISNPQDQLDFIQTCTTNYREKSGRIGIQRSGQATEYQQDKKLYSFKETLLQVQQSLHKTLGIEYPTNIVYNKKTIPTKGEEKLQKIGILGKDKKFNRKGMNHFTVLQIFSKTQAADIPASDFESFKKLMNKNNISEILENNKNLNSGGETISLAVGGSENIKFGIETGDIVAKL